MAKQVCNGAQLKCSLAVPPGLAVLTVLPANMTEGGGSSTANIMDYIPMMNVPTFGMCNTQSNPAVAATTLAASGTPTPAPCIPVIGAPWSPGSSAVMIGNQPALNDSSTCLCSYGGVIEVSDPGQDSMEIP
jgi:hypothetical protein